VAYGGVRFFRKQERFELPNPNGVLFRYDRCPELRKTNAIDLVPAACLACLTAIVALAWYVNGQQSTDIGARTAALLLQRQVIEGEGARFAVPATRPRSTFRLLFSLILRASLGKRRPEGQYGVVLDGLGQFLNGMTERR